MSKKQYTKPPLPLDEQAQLLLDRGLKGISKEALIQKLGNINYYRLRGYTYPYQNNYVDNTPFFSWMQHLNLVRNICAHYSRLFSRSFIVRPMLPTSKPVKWVNDVPAQDRIYISICIITYFLDICAPEFNFRKHLKEVMSMCRPAQLPSMGFPADWKNQALFMEASE